MMRKYAPDNRQSKLTNLTPLLGIYLAASGLAVILSFAAALVGFAGGKDVPLAHGSAQQTPLTVAEARKLLSEPRFEPPANWKWGQFKNADSAVIRYGYAAPIAPSTTAPAAPSTGAPAATSARAPAATSARAPAATSARAPAATSAATATSAPAPLTTSAKPIATIVILPGFTEFGEVYFETIKEFLAHNYAVYEMDWRGAGGSDRYFQNTNDNQKASSLGFAHDEDDLDQFLNAVVRRQTKGPIILVAHSLGSHIALRYLHDHPGLVEKAVLSAPPFDCPGTASPPWAVLLYSWSQCRFDRGNNYADGQGNWLYMAPKVSKMSTHSHDPARVRLEEAWGTADPKLQSGGATWKWLYYFQQSCDLYGDSNYAGQIKTPILIGCALSDRIANPKHQEQIAKIMPGCQLYKGEDARHDLFLEDDAHRGPWMQAVFKFLGPYSNN